MIIGLLFSQPLLFVGWLVAILFALTIHEFSHALAGYLLGDHTAKEEGRLTFNPMAHLDWFGFLMLLLVGFGWGKPVPFNPYNLKYPKWGPAIVSIAGPLSNLISFIFFGIILKLLITFTALSPANLLLQFLGLLLEINLILMIFNLIPIPPLDGSKVLFAVLPAKYDNFKVLLETRGPLILISLIILDNFLNLGLLSALFNWILNLAARFF